MARIAVFLSNQNVETDQPHRRVSKSCAVKLVSWQRHIWRGSKAIQVLAEHERTIPEAPEPIQYNWDNWPADIGPIGVLRVIPINA